MHPPLRTFGRWLSAIVTPERPRAATDQRGLAIRAADPELPDGTACGALMCVVGRAIGYRCSQNTIHRDDRNMVTSYCSAALHNLNCENTGRATTTMYMAGNEHAQGAMVAMTSCPDGDGNDFLVGGGLAGDGPTIADESNQLFGEAGNDMLFQGGDGSDILHGGDRDGVLFGAGYETSGRTYRGRGQQ
jgi:hypothetical protein